MLDYARQRAIEALSIPRKVIFATSGPAGVQVSECLCQSILLEVYLLVPKTSDHLFNLEHDPRVTLLSGGWELNGEAQVIPAGGSIPGPDLLGEPGALYCVLVRVLPAKLHIRLAGSSGNIETFDLRNEKTGQLS